MRNNEPTNNYVDIRARIARRILNHPLAQFVGYPTDEYRLSRLRQFADKDTSSDGFSFISLELRRAGTNVSLSIEQEKVWSLRDDGTRTDKDGNDQAQYNFRATVSWPCHGSQDAGTAIAWLRFYEEVALLAAELNAELANENVWRLVRTKEEREAQEAKKEAEKVHLAVVRAIDNVRQNMRVGSPPRNTLLQDLAGIPDGAYEHEFSDGKKYRLSVARSMPEAQNIAVVGMVARLS